MKRAQSALEYLMTYGWAILIIIIVAAALYAMGVFNPAAWSGKRVTGLAYFQVKDWKYTSEGNLSLVLGNKYGSAINVTGIGANCAGATNGINPEVVLAPNKDTTQTVAGFSSLAEGASVSCDVYVNYTDTGTSMTHNDYGSLIGPVEVP